MSRFPFFLFLVSVLWGMILVACTVAPPTPEPLYRLPFRIVPPAGLSLPTPTPFQPALPTPFPTISVEMYTTPLPPLILATPTPVEETSATPDLTVPYPPGTPSPAAVYEGPDVVTFLLIGSDKRPGSSFRTDTLIVVILRPRDDQISLISIPRDLWVYIPGWEMQRINTAYQHGEISDYPGGGPQLLKDTIEYNLGLRIDHTAMVEFDGFRRMIDTLGGIDVPVACAYTDWRLIDPSLDPENEANWHLYTVGPGLVHMDGDLALWYARSRLRSNDFDRGRRQQEILRAIYQRVLSADLLSKLPQLYNDLRSMVITDLGLTDLIKLATLAPGLSNADIRSYYIRPPLVTSWITPGGAYVLLPDQQALQDLILQALSASPRATTNEAIVVEIQNGTPFEGWDALAASRLNYAGYSTRIAPADRRDYATSMLIDLTPSPDVARGEALLQVLGFSPSQLFSLPDLNGTVHYRLILGRDYRPCFQPETLAP